MVADLDGTEAGEERGVEEHGVEEQGAEEHGAEVKGHGCRLEGGE